MHLVLFIYEWTLPTHKGHSDFRFMTFCVTSLWSLKTVYLCDITQSFCKWLITVHGENYFCWFVFPTNPFGRLGHFYKLNSFPLLGKVNICFPSAEKNNGGKTNLIVIICSEYKLKSSICKMRCLLYNPIIFPNYGKQLKYWESQVA